MTCISLIIPVFNEVEHLQQNLDVIIGHAVVPGCTLEIIVVDDGSNDGTWEVLADYCAREPRARAIGFTRNFGKEAAIQAGLSESTGAAAIVIDADLQHPPELIPEMIRQWSSNRTPVVEAVKRLRQPESRLSSLLGKGFYHVFGLASGIELRDHSDYKLLDRRVVDAYLALPERQRFFRGLIPWLGYASTTLPFDVPSIPPRSSRWRRLTLWRYAIRNITAFSSAPLYAIAAAGLSAMFIAVVIGAVSIYQKLAGVALDGFTTVNLLLVGIGGTLMLGMGIIGHYLAAIYDEIKSRPPYVKRPPQRPYEPPPE